MVANYSEEEVKKAHEILFNEGIKMRYQVAGKEYVDKALKNGSGSFAGAMQEVSLISCQIYERPSLTLSLVCNRILLGLNLDATWTRAQDAIFPQHRYALLPKPLHGACNARQGSAEQRCLGRRGQGSHPAGGMLLRDAGWY